MTDQSARSHNDSSKTYFIDSQSAAEMARLTDFDRYLTKAMGGALPEISDVSHIHKALDIACGSGGWVLDLAFAHPEMEVVGIDINRATITYAQSQAKAQRLDNASFRVMNAVEPLDFPNETFDLVNARSIASFMPATRWPLFIQECLRILTPGGILRLTEGEWSLTNTPASAALSGKLMLAAHRAGLGFSPDGRTSGITPVIAHFLRKAGFKHVQSRVSVVDFSAGTEANPLVFKDIEVLFQLIQPFLIKMGVTTQEEVQRLYEEFLLEMLRDDFCGIHFLLTAWGLKPE